MASCLSGTFVRMPRRTVFLLAGGVLLGFVVGISALASGNRTLGIFFLVGTPISALINGAMFTASNKRNRPGRPVRPLPTTGRMLSAASYSSSPSPAPPAGSQGASWTGGGNVVGALGRMNATFPLAVFTVGPGTATLRFQPRVLARLFGLRTNTWQPAEVLTAYPVRGRLTGFTRGVGIESTTEGLAYFWTFNPAAVLTELERSGFNVEWAERQIRTLS